MIIWNIIYYSTSSSNLNTVAYFLVDGKIATLCFHSNNKSRERLNPQSAEIQPHVEPTGPFEASPVRSEGVLRLLPRSHLRPPGRLSPGPVAFQAGG